MTAIIPAIDSDDRPFKFDPELKDSPNILDRYYKGIDREKMVIMKTKMPEWNQEVEYSKIKCSEYFSNQKTSTNILKNMIFYYSCIFL